jgi:hypothetical protein
MFSKARIDLGKASAVCYYYVHDFDFFLHIRRAYVSIEYHLLGIAVMIYFKAICTLI